MSSAPPTSSAPPKITRVGRVDRLRFALLGSEPTGGWAGWIAPLAIAILGGILRFWRLGYPGSLVFDETYYVKDAYALLQGGYEREWPEDANDSFTAGNPDVLGIDPSFVVHPPVGKWMIGLGLELFGADSSFAWRFSAALVGTLSILMIARIARRLFSSSLFGAVAGVLVAFDGTHFVHSRTSLLDLFLMFWIVAALGALLLDRDHTRRRLAVAVEDARDRLSSEEWRTLMRYGPALGWRPWRIVAGVCLGLALGTKWSGLYVIAVFGLMIVLWDVAARRTAGVERPWRAMLRLDAVPAFVSTVVVGLVVYVASWSGWIFSRDGWGRNWAAENQGWWSFLPDWFVSLAEYHRVAYEFHIGLDSEHPYMANPWGFIVQWRPTSFFYETGGPQDGCDAGQCVSAITSLGTPLLWWAAPLALLVCLVAGVLARDWRAGTILAGIAATWLPWLNYQDRTVFTFYSIVMVPFVVLAVTYALALLWGRGENVPGLRARRIVAGLFVAGVVLCFAYFWPIYTGTWIPQEAWDARMWLPSWV